MKAYSYFWPPRPEKAVARNTLGFYKRLGWVGQAKKNGTCTVLYITPDSALAKTRHNDDHKMWDPNTSKAVKWLTERLPAWTVLVCELLHSKGPDIKDTLYIFDILVYDGLEMWVRDLSFTERQMFLKNLFEESIEETWSHYILHNNVWLAKTLPTEMITEYMDRIVEEDSQYVEGIVLKDPDSYLEPCFKQKANSRWQVKCRKPSKNYVF